MKKIDFDDKDLAIVGLIVLGIACTFILKAEAISIVASIVAGVCGMVVGRKNGKENK